MTPLQEKNYERLIKKYAREISTSKATIEDDDFDDVSTEVRRGAGMLMNLRKASNHPLLIRTIFTDTKLKKMAKLLLNEPLYAQDGNVEFIYQDMQLHSDFEVHQLCCKFPSIASYKLSDDILLESGKFSLFDQHLPSLKEKKQRVLIFSQFTMILDIVEEYMRIRDHKYIRLDGSTKVNERLDLIDDFNSEESRIFVFLLSTKAGGMGINLTSATNVFIHDIDFNPFNDKQAEDRCHRVGQTKDVMVYRMISKGTVEEGIEKIANDKLKLGEDLVDARTGKKVDMKQDMKTLLRQALCV